MSDKLPTTIRQSSDISSDETMDLGWVVAFSLILFDILLALGLGPLVSRYWTKQIVADIWNQRVELEDLDGQIIKVPVNRITKDKDGNETVHTDMVVGPLWYTILWGAGTMAADHVKQSLYSAKGKMARALNTASAAGEALELDPKMAALLSVMPKKWVGPAAMIMQLLGKSGPSSGTQTPHRGGGGPI